MAQHVSRLSEPYSDLEVAPFEHLPHPAPQHFPINGDPNQQRHDAAEKQAVSFAHESSDLVAVPPKETSWDTGLEAIAPKEQPVSNETNNKTQEKKWKRRKWVVAIIIVAVVVVGAIVGGVAGSLLSNDGKPDPPSAAVSSSSASASPTSTTTTSTPVMSGPWPSLAVYSFPTAVSWGGPHVEVFALNSGVYPVWKYRPFSYTDGQSTWQPSTNSTRAFTSLGGQAIDRQPGIAAITRDRVNVDLFVTGTSLELYTKGHNESMVWDPSNTDWHALGGSLLSPPCVVSCAWDRIDVFGINDAHGLSQLSWTAAAGWHEWYIFTSRQFWTTYAPTAVSWAEGQYDIFLVGADNQALYRRYYDGTSWGPPANFELVGGFCTSRPVAVCRAEGLIDVFVRGGDAGLWHISFSQNLPAAEHWSDWTSISGNQTVHAEPDAVRSNYTMLHVFAWGSDDTLLHKTCDAQTQSWTPEEGFDVLGTGLSGPPKAVVNAGDIEVFVYLRGRQLGYKHWNSVRDIWTPPANDLERLGVV